MHQALPPRPSPHGMGPIYCPHMRSSPSPPVVLSLSPPVIWGHIALRAGGVVLSPSPSNLVGGEVAFPVLRDPGL